MWIFATKGYVSIVADTGNPNNLLVRGRIKGDIEALFPGAKVTETPFRDYRFRASLDRVDVAVKLAEHIGSISYTNFKNAAPKNRSGFLSRIWGIMCDEQDRRHPLTRKQRGRKYADIFHAPAKRIDPLSGYPLLPGDVDDPLPPWLDAPDGDHPYALPHKER